MIKNKNYYFILKFSLIVIFYVLTSCASAPTHTNEFTEISVKQESTFKNKNENQIKKDTSNNQTENTPIFISNSLDNYRLNTPENSPSFRETYKSDSIKDTTQKENNTTQIIDPYKAFPELAEKVFEHAKILYDSLYIDSAIAYLERFRIIKPLWATWEHKTDSLLDIFGKIRMNNAKKYEPLILEIQNMNRVQASYSLVYNTADSLISFEPGDSVVKWANKQKKIAYQNTLSKAKKEYQIIKSLADNNANFNEAEKKAQEFLLRYRDFDDILQIQSLIQYIQDLKQSTDVNAIKYWEQNDPIKSLHKVDELIKTQKYEEAKNLLIKLKASKWRKDAIDKLNSLSEIYCNDKRKTTSQIFAKAQKEKDSQKKKALLQEAIVPLDKCLSEYPENSQKNKILENKKFLEKELLK